MAPDILNRNCFVHDNHFSILSNITFSMKVLPLLLAAQYGYQHTVIAQAVLNYRCNGQWKDIYYVYAFISMLAYLSWSICYSTKILGVVLMMVVSYGIVSKTIKLY